MSDITWLGETLVLVGRETGFDVAGGPSTTFTYEGTHEAIASASAQITGANWRANYNTGTPKAILTVSTPDYGEGSQVEGVIATEFELVNNMDQRHGFEHKKSLALGVPAIDDIRVKLKANTTAAATAFTGNKRTLYEAMRLEQSSFQVSQWAFKMQQVVTRRAVLTVAQAGLNEVYTLAALIAETNPPDPYLTAITEATRQVRVDYYQDSIPEGHTLGWKKSGFSLNNIAGNRAVVSIEFWLEAWRNYYYVND